jgi:alpha-L-rhamnosidase
MRAPHHLRAEHLAQRRSASANGARACHGSSRRHRHQRAYQVEIDSRAQAQVESADSVLMPWPGADLGSRAHVEWRVKVWTDAGESDWCERTGIDVEVDNGPGDPRWCSAAGSWGVGVCAGICVLVS